MWKILILLLHLMMKNSPSACPCYSEALCHPIEKTSKQEVYFYASEADARFYKYFDWSRISILSIGKVNKNFMKLVCLAHSKKVKVHIFFDFQKTVLKNDSMMNTLVQNMTDIVKQYHLDGINIDFERILHQGDPAIEGLTKFVMKMSKSIKKINSKLEVSFAHNYLASGSALSYDVKGINQYIDYFVIMNYDFSKNSAGSCSGGDNAGLPKIKIGVESFKKQGVSPDKLILAFPWFGVQLQCSRVNEVTGECSGDCKNQKEICYRFLSTKLRNNSIDGRRYNAKTSSPFLIFKDDSKQAYRIDYDDYWSLKLKNQYAMQINAKGVGVFQGNCLPIEDSEEAVYDRKMLWNTLPLIRENYSFSNIDGKL